MTPVVNLFNQADGTALTSGATINGYNVHVGAPVASIDHPVEGTTGVKYPAASGATCQHRFNLDVTSSLQCTVEGYPWFPAAATATDEVLITIRPSGATIAARLVQQATTGKIQLQNTLNAAVWTSNAAYFNGPWRIKVTITAATTSTGTWSIAIYSLHSDDTHPIESGSGSGANFLAANMQFVDLGRLTAPAYAYTGYWDAFKIEAARSTGFGPTFDTPPAVDSTGLGYIGDSLTDEGDDGNTGTIKTAQVAVGWSSNSAKTKVDGLISRSISMCGVTPSAPDQIRIWRAAGFNPKYWIIALGTNGSADSGALQQAYLHGLLDNIALGTTGVYKVWLVGVAYQASNDSRAAAVLSAMNTVAAARTDVQVTVIDYNSLLHNGRDETGFWASDPHMTSTGYTARRSIIAAATPFPAAAATSRTVRPRRRLGALRSRIG